MDLCSLDITHLKGSMNSLTIQVGILTTYYMSFYLLLSSRLGEYHSALIFLNILCKKTQLMVVSIPNLAAACSLGTVASGYLSYDMDLHHFSKDLLLFVFVFVTGPTLS